MDCGKNIIVVEFIHMKKEIADKILQETESGYDLIALKFSQTRKHFWRGLEYLGDYVKDGDAVLDYGCGNGRLLELFKEKNDLEYYGLDVSQKLLGLAEDGYAGEKRHFIKINPSQSSLALENDFFNSVFSIAVFHHLPSRNKREEVARELFRVLKKDGYVIVTVWNLWQKKYFKNIAQNWKSKLLGDSDLDWNDCEISFTDNSGTKIERFHHAFTKRELKKLFESVGFKTKKCVIIKGRNIIYVGKK